MTTTDEIFIALTRNPWGTKKTLASAAMTINGGKPVIVRLPPGKRENIDLHGGQNVRDAQGAVHRGQRTGVSAQGSMHRGQIVGNNLAKIDPLKEPNKVEQPTKSYKSALSPFGDRQRVFPFADSTEDQSH